MSQRYPHETAQARYRHRIQGIHPRLSDIINDEVACFKVGGPLPISFEVDRLSARLLATMTTTERNWPDQPAQIKLERDLRAWCDNSNPFDNIGITDLMLSEASTNTEIAAHVDERARRRIEDYLHALAKELYEHELDEQFSRNGLRVRDPHLSTF